MRFTITKEDYRRSVIAGHEPIHDAIKRHYPHLSNISVDIATICVTDAGRGERYIYGTPAKAADLVLIFKQKHLLAFNPDWPNEGASRTIRTRRPLRIDFVSRKAKGKKQ
jgi:hypothetical protein